MLMILLSEIHIWECKRTKILPLPNSILSREREKGGVPSRDKAFLVWDQHRRVALYHRIEGGLVESWKESTGNRSTTVKGGAINRVV